MTEEDEAYFSKVVALGCGETLSVDEGIDELLGLMRLADRYQVEAIQGDVEQAVLDRLTVENCGRILSMTSGSGLVRLERASRELALREFDQFAESKGFMDVSEEVLGSLLDDDELISEREERVLKGVVRWMKWKDEGEIRGEGLLRKVRFPFMSGAFLADEVRGMLPGGAVPGGAVLEMLVSESALLISKPCNLWVRAELSYLDVTVLVPRRSRGVNWAEYAGGGERRLAAD